MLQLERRLLAGSSIPRRYRLRMRGYGATICVACSVLEGHMKRLQGRRPTEAVHTPHSKKKRDVLRSLESTALMDMTGGDVRHASDGIMCGTRTTELRRLSHCRAVQLPALVARPPYEGRFWYESWRLCPYQHLPGFRRVRNRIV